jgi:hypothetical protein
MLFKSLLFNLFKSVGIVNQRIRIALGKCAHVHSSLNFKITAVTPFITPRILYIPVFQADLTAVPSCQDRVVHVHICCAAVWDAVNSRKIVFESIDNFKRNGNRPCIVESISQLDLITLCDVVASIFDVSHCEIRSIIAS